MTYDEIRKESESFFEWPSDKRTYVTYTSCLLFANAVAAKERQACLECYSPDDTATDWADKIRARGEQ